MLKTMEELLRFKNDPLFFYGLCCVAGAMICLLLMKSTTLQILGVSAWNKPFKFFLATAIFVWTMMLYLPFLQNRWQADLYRWSMILFFTVELVLIVYQAAQGKRSHFNVDTKVDGLIFSIMGAAITILMLHTLYIAILFFSQKHFHAPDTLVLAVKLSLVLTVIFAFEGFLMGSALQHTVGSEDGSPGLPVVNWSRQYGDLRVAHFFGIHALQLVPVLSYLFARTKREVVLIAVVYFLWVTATLIQALQGRPFVK